MTPAWTRAATSKSSSLPVARRAFEIAAWSSRGGVKIDLPFRKRSLAVAGYRRTAVGRGPGPGAPLRGG